MLGGRGGEGRGEKGEGEGRERRGKGEGEGGGKEREETDAEHSLLPRPTCKPEKTTKRRGNWYSVLSCPDPTQLT